MRNKTSDQRPHLSLRDLAVAVAIVRDDPRYAEELVRLRARVRDAGGPELSTGDLLRTLDGLEVEPADLTVELQPPERGLRSTFEQMEGAIDRIREATRVLARGLEFIQYAFGSAEQLRRAVREAEPEPSALQGAKLLQRLTEGVADLPPADRWLGAIEDAGTADRLRQLVEDLAELRRLTEASRAGGDSLDAPTAAGAPSDETGHPATGG